MEAHPVGISHEDLIQKQVSYVLELWEQANPRISYWKKIKGAWFVAIRFILKAIDYFIQLIESTLLPGPDKKATVMKALGKVYDTIVPPLLPFILKPFNRIIRRFVIDVVASLIIDFIVSKYNNGNWNANSENNSSSPGTGLLPLNV